jgi:hypothetical protein
MATEDYIPVVGDDWYQRRRNDAEGRFFRGVADQGPRSGRGGSTRQGIYCLTANGRLLAYRNSQGAGVMRQVFRDGLAAWRELPESERRPGAVVLEDLDPVDPDFARIPPEGGLILNVYSRALERDAKGGFADAACAKGSGDEVARDHLWLTQDEWKSLVPSGVRLGEGYPVPERVARRIARFHLVDNTRGEPPLWGPGEIRSLAMTLTVAEMTTEQFRLRLDGSALLSTEVDVATAERGFDVRLLGHLTYDRKADRFTRFDIVAVGDHWGEGLYTAGARPGHTPLGIAFELSRGDAPADRVPPQAARLRLDYLGR